MAAAEFETVEELVAHLAVGHDGYPGAGSLATRSKTYLEESHRAAHAHEDRDLSEFPDA